MTALTLFSTFRPDPGPRGAAFVNATRSWKRIEGEIEVLLLGRDPGLDAAAARLGCRHVAEVAVSARGVPTVSGLFAAAQREARHELLCYVNADLLLPAGLAAAVGAVNRRFGDFLVVGRRTNLRVDGEIPENGWDDIWRRARNEGTVDRVDAIDYFAFRRGFFARPPDFEIGRIVWDNWMIGNARRRGTVVDASPDIVAIHQDHAFGRTRQEDLMNRRRAGRDPILTIASAHCELRDGAIRPRSRRERWLDAIRGRAQHPGPWRAFWRGWGGLPDGTSGAG